MFDFLLCLFDNCHHASELPLAPLEETPPPPMQDSRPWYFSVFNKDPKTKFTVKESKLDIIKKCILSEPVVGPFFECKIDLQSFVLFYYSETADEISESPSEFLQILYAAIDRQSSIKDISCLVDLPHTVPGIDLLKRAVSAEYTLAVEYLASHCVSNGNITVVDFHKSPEIFAVFKNYLSGISTQLNDTSKELYSKIFEDPVLVSEPDSPKKIEDTEEALMERIQNLELLMTSFGIPIFLPRVLSSESE